MKILNWLALLFVVIGALNWGCWGLFQVDLVAQIFQGASTGAARIVYCLVGLSGIWSISFFKHICCCHHHKR